MAGFLEEVARELGPEYEDLLASLVVDGSPHAWEGSKDDHPRPYAYRVSYQSARKKGTIERCGLWIDPGEFSPAPKWSPRDPAVLSIAAVMHCGINGHDDLKYAEHDCLVQEAARALSAAFPDLWGPTSALTYAYPNDEPRPKGGPPLLIGRHRRVWNDDDHEDHWIDSPNSFWVECWVEVGRVESLRSPRAAAAELRERLPLFLEVTRLLQGFLSERAPKSADEALIGWCGEYVVWKKESPRLEWVADQGLGYDLADGTNPWEVKTSLGGFPVIANFTANEMRVAATHPSTYQIALVQLSGETMRAVEENLEKRAPRSDEIELESWRTLYRATGKVPRKKSKKLSVALERMVEEAKVLHALNPFASEPLSHFAEISERVVAGGSLRIPLKRKPGR